MPWRGDYSRAAAGGIPRFDAVNRALSRATGWEIVAVPGLVREEPFFTHLANRRFPVTVWLRKPFEFGLMRTADGVRAYGAGLLSSGGELAYFVLESFEQLMRETAPDFAPIYARLRGLEAYPADG